MSKEESLRRIADAAKALTNELIEIRTHHGGCVRGLWVWWHEV